MPPDPQPCGAWEAHVGCADCGACCREAFDAVPVEPEDLATRAALPELLDVASDGWTSLRRVPSPSGCGTRCALLAGDGAPASPFRCTRYAARPTACRELEVGAPNCYLARTRVGLSQPVG